MSVGESRLFRGSVAAVVSVSVALAGACARQGAPPGGPQDLRPPVVVRTEPDTFATVDDPRAKVRFHFDERISERVDGTMDEVVVVSPATGDVRVSHSRQSLTVEIDGGFQPGLVYRVTLLPAVRDMFSNQLRDPFELVFSTGAEYAPSVVAGLVWDRISGESVDAVEVRAVADGPDSVVHVAQTDDDGVYAFRYLPPGRYRFVAFQDQNRDGIVDRMENQGTRGLLLNSPLDSVLSMAIGMLMPDTTAARITSTEILDSLTLVVEFDDYLDPAVGLDNVGAALATDPAADPAAHATAPPGVASYYHEHEYSAYVQTVVDSFLRLDSLEAQARAAAQAEAAAQDATEVAEVEEADSIQPSDTTQVTDTLGSPDEVPVPGVQDTTPARRAPPALSRPGGREPPPRPDGSTPPSRRLVLLLAERLVPNVP